MGDRFKKILLISNDVLHYREKIYNNFYGEFHNAGYDFQVASNSFQDVGIELHFKHYQLPFSSSGYKKLIDDITPACVILFLHLKDRIMLPLIIHCKIKKIPVIYWNHGINIKTPNARMKNFIFHRIHDLCDALITYTPDMKKFFTEKNQRKLFVAYNTLDFSDVDKNALPSREETRKKYGIKQDVILLYASRVLPYKRADLLINLFRGNEEIAVVIVGPGMPDSLIKMVDKYGNLYYLGEKYGADVDAVYKAADIFSTPGHIGLAINQALFWGLPVVLLNAVHAPEIYYMKEGETGYIVDTEEKLKERILELAENDELRKHMSDQCRSVYEKEVSIDRMFEGFLQAVDHVGNRG